MTENEEHLQTILEIFKKEQLLDEVIIIGSWALYFYKKIFEDFQCLIKTRDIDFYVPNIKRIKTKDLTSELSRFNYDLRQDYLTNKTVFVSQAGFEIEFLTHLNRNGLSCVRLGESNIYAESLSYLEIFTGNFLEIDFNGLTINVASPSSYVFQKLLIKRNNKDKQEKDIQSIITVLGYIKSSMTQLKDFNNLYKTLPNSWKKKILANCRNYGIDLTEYLR